MDPASIGHNATMAPATIAFIMSFVGPVVLVFGGIMKGSGKAFGIGSLLTGVGLGSAWVLDRSFAVYHHTHLLHDSLVAAGLLGTCCLMGLLYGGPNAMD
jgi:hypothetical protein